MLTIAVDYDMTFTAEPFLVSEFSSLIKKCGPRAIMVTARQESEESIDEINAALDHWNCQLPVIFTNRGSKLRHMENLDVKVDIWLDDDPKVLVNGW